VATYFGGDPRNVVRRIRSPLGRECLQLILAPKTLWPSQCLAFWPSLARSTMSGRDLHLPERLHGIDLDGAAGGHVTGDEHHPHEQQPNGHEREWIGRAHVVEEAG
jgi:hypothetical protein